MRKPRDYDSELKALDDKAKLLRSRKAQHLGELVIATGADTLATEQLAGALLAAASSTNTAAKEAWQARGAAFFRGRSRKLAAGDRGNAGGAPAGDRGEAPARSEADAR